MQISSFLSVFAIAATLSKDAEIYLFDEPTAFLDVEQRLIAARVIRKMVESRNAASLIVDHDIVFIDYISDRAMLFNGTPGLEGHASKPTDLSALLILIRSRSFFEQTMLIFFGEFR